MICQFHSFPICSSWNPFCGINLPQMNIEALCPTWCSPTVILTQSGKLRGVSIIVLLSIINDRAEHCRNTILIEPDFPTLQKAAWQKTTWGGWRRVSAKPSPRLTEDKAVPRAYILVGTRDRFLKLLFAGEKERKMGGRATSHHCLMFSVQSSLSLLS